MKTFLAVLAALSFVACGGGGGGGGGNNTPPPVVCGANGQACCQSSNACDTNLFCTDNYCEPGATLRVNNYYVDPIVTLYVVNQSTGAGNGTNQLYYDGANHPIGTNDSYFILDNIPPGAYNLTAITSNSQTDGPFQLTMTAGKSYWFTVCVANTPQCNSPTLVESPVTETAGGHFAE